MPNDSTYGGTIPEAPTTTSTTVTVPTEPTQHELARTGNSDVLGPLVVAALFFIILGVTALTWARERSHKDDLVIAGYGGTPYPPVGEGTGEVGR